MPKIKIVEKKLRRASQPSVGFSRKRRHIEDIPFFQLHHGYDDLPLDPARPIVVEKIRKLKTIFNRNWSEFEHFPPRNAEKFRNTKRAEFANDLDLHVCSTNEVYVKSNGLTVNDVPAKMQRFSRNRGKSVKQEAIIHLLSNCNWLESTEFGE